MGDKDSTLELLKEQLERTNYAQYLLSKYPDLRDERIDFYEAIGL